MPDVLGNDVVGSGGQRAFVDAVVWLVARDLQATWRLNFDAGSFQQASQPDNAPAVEVL